MATSTENQRTHNALNDTLRVHIADLKDDLTSDDARNTYIEAVVQLVWPFSSTTSELSLLLIEKDVSLRDNAAQIRVTFHDACAREVAKSRIGIGDVLRLDLRGASAEVELEELSTPGKKAGYDLHFRKSVTPAGEDDRDFAVQHVAKQTQVSTYDGQVKALDYVDSVLPVVLNGTHSTPKPPLHNGSIDISKTKLSSVTPGPKRIPRTSLNSFPSSSADPFSEDDGYTQGHRRKRTKFARRSNQWRLADASDEESESRPGETQADSLLDQPVAGPDVHIAPSIDVQEVSPTDVTIATEGQKLSQSMLSEGHFDIEDETRVPKVIAIDDEQPVPDVQKVEVTISDDHVSESEEHISTLEGPRIPVERLTPDRAATLAARTPTSTALASPGLPLVSPSIVRMPEPSDPPQPAIVESVVTSMEETQPHEAMPAAIVETDEIDLDKLQEQIDMSNAEFAPEALEQGIEDEDLYGPPQDRETGMNLQHIEEIRSRISSHEPESLSVNQQPADLINEVSLNNDVWVGLDGYVSPDISTLDSVSKEIPFETLVTDPLAFQSYPYQFEHLSEYEDGTRRDINTRPAEQGTVSSVAEPTTESFHLDGIQTSEAINEDLSHVFEQPSIGDIIDDVQIDYIPPQLEVDQPSATSVHFAPTVGETTEESLLNHAHGFAPASPHAIQQLAEDEHIHDTPQADPTAHEALIEIESNMPVNVFTPEATQVTEAHTKDDSITNHQVQAQLPPTPTQSQIKFHQDIVEDSSSNQVDQPVPDFINLTPARPISSSNQRNQDQDEGIASPYFTSHTSVLTPATAMHSVKVPASSRMRLRSSSPADLPVHHLESEKLAAVEMSKSQASALFSRDQTQLEAQGGIATPLEYYARLETLKEYYNQHVDVMAVSLADSLTSERAKSGPKDFFITLHLVDHSVQEANISISAQIFRPRKSAIPIVRRGDVLLLRRFKVQTKSHKPMLLSTDESAWAVYQSRATSDTHEIDDVRVVDTPIISGPPIEHGPFEADNASRLLKWWLTNGSKHQFEATADFSPVKAPKTAGSKASRKPAPAPIDLRRSPRKTGATAGVSAKHSPTSPVFQPESPAQSHITAPSSRSRASPHSPSSVRSTRSQHAPQKSQPIPALNAPATTPPRKQKSKSNHESPSPSPNLDNPATFSVVPPSTVPRNFSSSNSVASSVTQTSGSDKRRRYERRSISLVHKLRDGTEWVDIEQEEIFSVTDSESGSNVGDDNDDDNDTSGPREATDHEHGPDQSVIDTAPVQSTVSESSEPQVSTVHSTRADIEMDTPSKKPRGRPRRHPIPGSTVNDIGAPPPDAELQSEIPADNTTSTLTRPRTPQPEDESNIAAEPRSSPDPLAVDIEGQNLGRDSSQSHSHSQSQSPTQDRRRVTRSQTAGSMRDG